MTATLITIEEAMRTRTPITFRYERPGKTPGTRSGNPHIAFIHRMAKTGEEHVNLLLWQTAGATDSGQTLPSWRTFSLNDITEPTLVPEASPFDIAEGYKPEVYEHPIAKVSMVLSDPATSRSSRG